MKTRVEETIKRQPALIDLYVVAKKSLEAAEKVMGQLMDFQIDNEYVSAAIILLKAKSQIDEVFQNRKRTAYW